MIRATYQPLFPKIKPQFKDLYEVYRIYPKAGRMLTCTRMYQNKMMMTVSRNAMKNLTVTQRIIVVIKKMLCVCDIIEHVYLFLLISI